MLIEVKEVSGTISGPTAAANIFRSILLYENEVDQCKEHLWVIGLNNRHAVMYIDLVTLGLLNKGLSHPREVFRMAIFKAAACIMIGHNHPSGELSISEEDRNVTYQLWQAGNILDIPLLDHIVIANGNLKHFSFQDRGYFDRYAKGSRAI
jgi:DNA repair protein RadC